MNSPTQPGDVDPGHADLRREALVRLPVLGHPFRKISGHGMNVRSAYPYSQADCTVCGIDACAVSEQLPGMDRKEQGKLLRKWRRWYGEKRGRKLTLMELAGLVSDVAEQKGFDQKSRRIPGSHAAMTRWELGDVDQTLAGLDVLAAIYGVLVTDLMRDPAEAATRTEQPPEPPPPDDGEEKMVEAFRDFLAQRKG
jgi:hypothetical protein